MKTIYADIIEAKNQKSKLLAVLLDPDKVVLETIDTLISKINQSPATHIFIGGSLVFMACALLNFRFAPTAQCG
jgi:putative glycerol-1-phosphate prenyltransferase